MKLAALSVILIVAAPPVWAEALGSFEGVVLHSCHEADTCTFTIPGVRPSMGEKIAVRLRGVSTPKIGSTCEWEQVLARQTRDFLMALLQESPRVDLVDVERGKDHGIVATVIAHGVDAGKVMIEKGWARRHDGGKREPWCK